MNAPLAIRGSLTVLLTMMLTLPACITTETGDEPGPPIPQLHDAPNWVKENRHPDYPTSAWLVGIGFEDGSDASAKEAAELRALQSIAEQIETKIESSLSEISRQLRKGDRDSFDVDVKSNTKQTVDELIRGSYKADTYVSPGSGSRTYALRVLNRKDLVAQFLSEADDQVRETRGYLTLANESLSALQAGTAMENLLRGRNLLEDIDRNIARSIAVLNNQETASRIGSMGIPDLSRDIANTLNSLASRIRIEIVEGNEQKGAPGAGLRVPLTIKALWESPSGLLPVTHFPVGVNFDREPSPQVVLTRDTTDHQGIARAVLNELQVTGDHANSAHFGIDATKFAGRNGRSYSRKTTFTYYLPTIKTARVMIAVVETIDQDPVHPPSAEGLIASVISKAGFPQVKLDPSISPSEFVNYTVRQVREKVGDDADYVIYGTIDAQFDSKERSTNISVARVHLKALELVSGHVLDLSLGDGDAAEGFAPSSPYEAGRRAITNVMQNGGLLEKIELAFKNRIAGHDWGDTSKK